MFAPALHYGGAAYGAYGPYAGYGAFPGAAYGGAYGLGMWNQQHQGQHAPAMHLQNLDQVELENEAAVTAAVTAAAGYCAANPGACTAAASQAAHAAKSAFEMAKTAADKIRASDMAQKAKSLLGSAWGFLVSLLGVSLGVIWGPFRSI